MERRRSTYSAWKKGSLILCAAVIVATNAIMLIYYVLNPTRKLLNPLFPVGFTLTRIIIIVILCIIASFIFSYHLTYVKIISGFSIFLMAVEVIFGCYFVFFLVIRIDNFMDEREHQLNDGIIQYELEQLLGCCFDAVPATLEPIDSLLSTIPTISAATSVTTSVKTSATTSTTIPTKSAQQNQACLGCTQVAKEHVRNIATLFSTGFLFNILMTSWLLVLLVVQELKIRISQ